MSRALIGITALCLTAVAWQVQRAFALTTTFIAHFDGGTLNADYSFGSGTASTNGTLPSLLSTGYGGTGGSILNSSGTTLKYSLANNLNSQKGEIELKYRLPWFLGTDYTKFIMNNPSDVYYDSASAYYYITDTDNDRIIKTKIDGTGWTTLGSYGGGPHQFNNPTTLVYDAASEYLYIVDYYNYRIVKTKIDGTGWTTYGSYASSIATGKFYEMRGIAYDAASDYIYVADSGHHRIIKTKMDGTGWTAYGTTDSTPNSVGGLYSIYGIAYDAGTGFIYTTESTSSYQHIVKTKIDGTGWTTYGTAGTGTGQFSLPRDIDVDPATGNIYVADVGAGYRLIKTKIDGSDWSIIPSAYSTFTGLDYDSVNDQVIFATRYGINQASFSAGSAFYGTHGSGVGQFYYPYFDYDASTGFFYVADYGNHRIIKTKIDGTGWTTYGSQGTSGVGKFYNPRGIAYDTETGDIYVADYRNNRIVKTAIDGTGWTSYPIDSPINIDLDQTNDMLYVVSNNVHSVKKIPVSGFTLGTFNATGTAAGTFNSPFDIDYDAATGYYYIADLGNHRIIKTMADGTGWTAYGTNGTGTGNFSSPRAIDYDAASDYIYVADTGNNRLVKTKIDGTGWTAYGSLGTSTAGAGKFQGPRGIDYDPASEYIYVSDYSNHRVVKTKIDGTGWTTFGSSGSGANNFFNPQQLTYDAASDYLYVADSGNLRVVKTKIDGTGWTTFGDSTTWSDLSGVEYDPSTEFIYVMSDTSETIVKTKIDGTGLTSIPTCFGRGGFTLANAGYVTYTSTYHIVSAISTNARQLGSSNTAGSGTGQFSGPVGIQVNSTNGDIYVADTVNNRLVKTKIDGTGWTAYGTLGPDSGQFYTPRDLFYDVTNDLLYVVDSGNNRIVRTSMLGASWSQHFITSPGSVYFDSAANKLLLSTSSYGSTTVPSLSVVPFTTGIGYNRAIFSRALTGVVATSYNPETEMIYSLAASGTKLIQHKYDGTSYYEYGSSGSGTGQFSAATDLDYDAASDYIYVADAGNNRIVKTKVDGTGWATYGASGTGTGQFNNPRDVFYGPTSGYLYIADYGNNRIIKTKFDGSEWYEIPVYAPRSVSVEDGYIYIVSGQRPYLIKIKDQSPSYLVNDNLSVDVNDSVYDEASGYLYVADGTNDRLVRLRPDGTDATTFGSLGNGTNQFNNPRGIAYDQATGYIYVADYSNNRIVKTKIDGTGWTTYGTMGSGTGQLSSPTGLDYDPATDFIYVADYANNRIVKTKIDGTGWTVYGTSGTGTGQFRNLRGLDYDPATDFIYVADYVNDRIVKTKIDGTGWTTYGTTGAGTGQFNDPRDIAYDSTTGLIYVADGSNRRIVWTAIDGTGWTEYPVYVAPYYLTFNRTLNKAFLSSERGLIPLNLEGFDYYQGSNTLSSAYRGLFTNGYWYLTESNGSTSTQAVRTNTAGDDFTSLGSYGSGIGKFNDPGSLDIDRNTGLLYIPDANNSRLVRTQATGVGWSSLGAGATEVERTLFSTNGVQPLVISFFPTESKIGVTLAQSANGVGVGKSSVMSGDYNDWQTLKLSYDNTSGVTLRVNDEIVLQKSLTWSSFSWGDSFTVGNNAQDPTLAFLGAIDELEISSIGSDTTNPAIPTLVTARDVSGGTTDLSAAGWNKYATPYFTWTATDEGGAGIKDYLVYFGTSSTADPYLQGTAQTAANYSAANLVSGTTYYLIAQARDNVGNLSTKTTLFTYRYDSTAPQSPTMVTVDPPGNSRVTHFDFTWPVSGSGTGSDTGGSSIQGYQYRIKSKVGNYSDWSAIDNLGTASFDIPNPDTDYLGTNVIEIRAVDNAGNVDDTPLSNNFYYSAATTAPRNLSVTPTGTSTSNSFTFDWDAPTSNPGLGYYYTINVLPTADNKLTAADSALPAGPYASQQGDNTLYVLAADGTNTNYDSCNTISGNPEVDGCSRITFSARTPAPGYPGGLLAYDISNRDTEEYAVALKWSAPTNLGTGFDGYNIYRSATEAGTFNPIGASSGTSYIDDGLSKETPYYYQLKSKDNTGQTSIASQTINIVPTGRYTNPPTLKANTLQATPKAYSAVVTWQTTRADSSEADAGQASSFVLYGTERAKIGKENGGFTVGDPNKVESHSISLTGLQPSTVYYYQAMWEDVDGNQGLSDILTLTTGTKPEIAGVAADNITLSSVNINWQSINMVAARVTYCSPTACQDATVSSTPDQAKHTINLASLQHSTHYNYTISTTDIDGNITPSDTYYFDTLTLPVIEGDLKVDQDTAAPTTTYRFRWTTNVDTTTIMYYTREGETAKSISKAEYAKEHDVTVSQLADQSKYSFEATGVDIYGNKVDNPLQSSVSTPQDSRAPVVSNLTIEIKSSGVSGSQKDQIVASWETDELASSQIEYGPGISGTDYGQKTKEDSALTNYHVVIVNELEPSKMYHLRVVSRDAAGNPGYSDDTTAITGKMQNSAIDLIINSLRKSLGWLSALFR